MVSLSGKHYPSWKEEDFQSVYHSHGSEGRLFPGKHNRWALLSVSSHYKRHLTEFDKHMVGRPRLVRPYLQKKPALSPLRAAAALSMSRVGRGGRAGTRSQALQQAAPPSRGSAPLGGR
ncbi:rCG26529, partial [Rattus norvegicus]